MKLPFAVTLILVLVTAGTITICLSGAVTPGNSEYGSIRAVFHQYLGGRPHHHLPTPAPISDISR